MRSIAHFAIGALVAAVPFMTPGPASAGGGFGPGGGHMPDLLSGGSGTLDFGVLIDIGVNLDACGAIDLLGCERIQVLGRTPGAVDPSLLCENGHLGLAGYTACADDCEAGATLACRAGCDDDCTADCDIGVGFNAAAYCEATCLGEASAECSAMILSGECDSPADCETAARALCGAECQAAASVWGSAGCGVKCVASCDASCAAEANLGCQIECASSLYADLGGVCHGDLDAGRGMFCDGQYISGVLDVDACVDALIARGLDVDLY